MKATPIAEYLQRKSAYDAPAELAPPVFPARRSAANDDPEPDFRKSGLVAALARRSPDQPALVRPLDASAFAPRRAAPPPPPRSAALPEPDTDMEAQLAEAYHRGVQEGLDTGKAEAATARALERAEWQKRAVIEKLDFQMNEFVRLSETVANGFAEIEQRIAEATARVLKPLLHQEVQKQVLDELAENLARLTRGGGVRLLKVTGPERLLSQLKTKLEPLAVEIEYIEDAGVEVSVAAQATEIRSELASWARLIEDLVESG